MGVCAERKLTYLNFYCCWLCEFTALYITPGWEIGSDAIWYAEIRPVGHWPFGLTCSGNKRTPLWRLTWRMIIGRAISSFLGGCGYDHSMWRLFHDIPHFIHGGVQAAGIDMCLDAEIPNFYIHNTGMATDMPVFSKYRSVIWMLNMSAFGITPEVQTSP